ncbi:MAG: manganese efflux pump MntP family protein [Bacteroidales bacterium]
MSLLELILISIGLAMDCFAVSFSAGALQKELKIKQILILALSFGLFQAIMPVIGWFGGEVVIHYISSFDHWIAFVILFFIGGKMLIDGVQPNKEEKKIDVMKPLTLLTLSIATSIDALAVGFSFALLEVKIWLSALIIGITSFLMSITGVWMGKRLCCYIKPNYAEILGGFILLAIGTKILLEHLL